MTLFSPGTGDWSGSHLSDPVAVFLSSTPQAAVVSAQGGEAVQSPVVADPQASPTGDPTGDHAPGPNSDNSPGVVGNGLASAFTKQVVDFSVVLGVVDVNGDGRNDVVLSNSTHDQVSVRYASPFQPVVQATGGSVLSPGAFQVADLNRDGFKDLVVADRDANRVLVFLGTGDGQFGPAQGFGVGTHPVGVTVAFLNDDLIPDPADPAGQKRVDPTPDVVVANQDSNDVSILFGRGQGAGWTLTTGPRLPAGDGPVRAVVGDFTGPRGIPDGIPDLLVVGGRSNSGIVLVGLGKGSFAPRNPEFGAVAPDVALSAPGDSILVKTSGALLMRFFLPGPSSAAVPQQASGTFRSNAFLAGSDEGLSAGVALASSTGQGGSLASAVSLSTFPGSSPAVVPTLLPSGGEQRLTRPAGLIADGGQPAVPSLPAVPLIAGVGEDETFVATVTGDKVVLTNFVRGLEDAFRRNRPSAREHLLAFNRQPPQDPTHGPELTEVAAADPGKEPLLTGEREPDPFPAALPVAAITEVFEGGSEVLSAGPGGMAFVGVEPGREEDHPLPNPLTGFLLALGASGPGHTAVRVVRPRLRRRLLLNS
jgi:hypothetical protein